MNESAAERPMGRILELIRKRPTEASAFLWAAAITAAIAIPWISPGFLFGTDWSGPRRIDWPVVVSSTAPTQVLLAMISNVLSAEFATKLLVVGSLFVAALTAYRALPVGDFVPRGSAALIYVLNPFVYGRIHYGQFALLSGYALLPWVATRIYRLVGQPDVWRGLGTAASLVLLAAFTPHLLLPALLLLAASAVVAVVNQRLSLPYVYRLVRSIMVTAGGTLVASVYWLIPYLAGQSIESRVIAHVNAGDLAAYSAVPDSSFGLFPNLLGLYGFWAENVQRFPSLKLFVSYWFVALFGLILLAALGALYVFLVRDEIVRGLRWWVVALIVAAIIAVVLEAGVTEPHVAPVVRWIDNVFPPYRGMRDAGKWAVMLAVVYAQLIPLGIIAMRDWLQRRPHRVIGELGSPMIAGLALALPLYYGSGLLFGIHGEIRPSEYPSGWYAADRVMVADPRPDRALFLPWHLYLRLSFVHNVNSVVATPAPSFFRVPIITSLDAEVAGISPPSDPEQRAISALVESGSRASWAQALASRNIKYVLVAREVDAERFAFLDQQPGLVRVGDYGSILLYRNTLLP